MEITFKKGHLNSNLFYRFFFVIPGLIMLKSNQAPWHAILSVLLPIPYIAKYCLLKHYKYLTLDKGVIKVNNLFGKEIKITKINQIEKYAGKDIIKTNKKNYPLTRISLKKNHL
jgi:hypothetical protein